MKALYLDPFSGVSGDMFLGALLDLGVELDALRKGLAQLPVTGYHLHAKRCTKAGITGVKLDVHVGDDPDHLHGAEEHHRHAHPHGPHADLHPAFSLAGSHDHPQPSDPAALLTPVGPPQAGTAHGAHEARDFRTISTLIARSPLSAWARERALGVFRRIAEAEGKIHGLPPEQVHFHEVGAVDSIVDIVGGCLAVEILGRPRVFAAPLVEGRGWVRCRRSAAGTSRR